MTQKRETIENNHTIAVTLRELSEAVNNLADAGHHTAAEKVANIIITLANNTEGPKTVGEANTGESYKSPGEAPQGATAEQVKERVRERLEAAQQAEERVPGYHTLLESIFRSLANSDLATDLKEKIDSVGAPTAPCDCGVCQPQTLKSALDQVEGGVDTGDLRIDSTGRVYANGQLVGYAVIRR